MTRRRFIEEHFPVRRVSDESSREKTIRHGHMSTLHLWWSRKPLAASRATIYASLIPTPDDDREVSLRNLEIARLSEWRNPIDKEMVDKARKRILDYNGSPPRVLDPFAGGGSIPLEALRLGCEVYASDYNPVSNLIVKAATVYPFQQGDHDSGLKSHADSRLADDIRKWSRWVIEEARKELADFFPDEKEGEPVGYLWSRCITCQNPRCGAVVPLINQFLLADTKKKKITLLPSIKGKKLQLGIAGDGKVNIPKDFNPKKGTVDRGKATCLVCGYRMDGNIVKSLFAQEKNTEVMNVVIVKPKGRSGKLYKIATKNNLDVFKKASDQLKKKQYLFEKKYGIDPIPNEPTPEGKGSGAERAFSVRLYNMNTWGDLFNNRQKLVMLTFLEKILAAAGMMDKNSKDSIRTLSYLAIMLDRLADKNANLVTWQTNRENIAHVFVRQALPIVWGYTEVNPFTSVGWPNMEEWVMRVLEHLESIDAEPATVRHTSATALPFEDGFFDAVITDPPYYDNVPYSHLSDFFYVWLKRALGTRCPELFSTPLTPKGDEIVAYSNGPGGMQGGKEFFEEMLEKSFREIHRVIKLDGISVIVYAHKSTEGWETLINSLLRSGLVVTAAWPIHTELKERLRSKKSAALLSSIYMVCRKLEKKPMGFYRDVKRDLQRYLDKKLDQLWGEGISGADFFIASIGSAIEVYGKYDKVINDKDQEVSVIRMLEDTRAIVTNYAIDRVSRGEFADRISKMTRFYILWRWTHGEAMAPFDEARKLAQSVGIDLADEWDTGFIRKAKEHIRVVGPDERESENLEESDELIDVLHHALRLWKGQKVDEASKFLDAKGYKNNEVMRRVAQAVSESLSDSKDSKEKDWIDGLFTGALGASRDPDQTKLF